MLAAGAQQCYISLLNLDCCTWRPLEFGVLLSVPSGTGMAHHSPQPAKFCNGGALVAFGRAATNGVAVILTKLSNRQAD